MINKNYYEEMEKRRIYYFGMINQLLGLRDDLEINSAPDEAKLLLNEVIEICQSDYNITFGGESLKYYGEDEL